MESFEIEEGAVHAPGAEDKLPKLSQIYYFSIWIITKLGPGLVKM